MVKMIGGKKVIGKGLMELIKKVIVVKFVFFIRIMFLVMLVFVGKKIVVGIVQVVLVLVVRIWVVVRFDFGLVKLVVKWVSVKSVRDMIVDVDEMVVCIIYVFMV